MLRPIRTVRQKIPMLAGPGWVAISVPRNVIARRAVLLIWLGLAAGCQRPQPDFLTALQRNCEHGGAQACAMLDSIQADASPDTGIDPPLHSREIVQAIVAGMSQQRLHAARFHRPELPSLVEDPKDW